jgi:hypothetical protein
MTAHATRWRRAVRRVVAVAGLVLLAVTGVGCGQTGSATTRIDEAEDEIVQLVEAITEAVELEVTLDRPLGSRSRCQAATGAGASNAITRRGPVPATDEPVGRAAAILLGAGYELVDAPELGEGIFARRDGIRITVFVDAPTDQLAIDANTGCRALPR